MNTLALANRIVVHQRLIEDAGFEISVSRFPYTYHHDLVREQGGGTSRADVADRMRAFMVEHGETAYGAAILLGAILYIAREQPLVFVRAMMDPDFSGRIQELVTDTSKLPLLYR